MIDTPNKIDFFFKFEYFINQYLFNRKKYQKAIQGWSYHEKTSPYALQIQSKENARSQEKR